MKVFIVFENAINWPDATQSILREVFSSKELAENYLNMMKESKKWYSGFIAEREVLCK